MFSPPEYSFRWRFSYHIRKRHSVMSLWHVVAGRSRLSRVQLVMTLFNQVLACLALPGMWCHAMCYVETELTDVICVARGLVGLALADGCSRRGAEKPLDVQKRTSGEDTRKKRSGEAH